MRFFLGTSTKSNKNERKTLFRFVKNFNQVFVEKKNIRRLGEKIRNTTKLFPKSYVSTPSSWPATSQNNVVAFFCCFP